MGGKREVRELKSGPRSQQFGNAGLHLQESAQSERPQRLRQTGHSWRGPDWMTCSAGLVMESSGGGEGGSAVMDVDACSLSEVPLLAVRRAS